MTNVMRIRVELAQRLCRSNAAYSKLVEAWPAIGTFVDGLPDVKPLETLPPMVREVFRDILTLAGIDPDTGEGEEP